jgi:hypothetical protein
MNDPLLTVDLAEVAADNGPVNNNNEAKRVGLTMKITVKNAKAAAAVAQAIPIGPCSTNYLPGILFFLFFV